MSEVVENVSEQQNSAPLKEEEAQPSETVKETTNNVEAVPAANVSSAAAEDADESSKPAAEDSSSTSPKVDDKKSPVKRTPSKRMSFIERAQKESEELVKNMGGSLEIEGGRRTRSSTRGTPTRSTAVSTPPPTKKARSSPASGASTPTRARGRGRKIETTVDGTPEEETTPAASKKKTSAKGRKSAAKETIEDEELDEKQEDTKEAEKKPDDNDDDDDDDDEGSKVGDGKVDSSESNAGAIQHKDAKSLETAASSSDVAESKDALVGTEEKVTKNEEDKTDSVGVLESVVEETQSQIADESIPTEKNITNKPDKSSEIVKVTTLSKPIKNDSPMETEDPKLVENVAEESKVKNISVVVVVEDSKEPTPEPMEIDSSSKSNDSLEKMEDDDVSEDVVEAPSSALKAVVEKVGESQYEKSKTSSANISKLNNIEKVEGSVKQINSVEPVVVNNSIDAKLLAEPAAINVAIANNKEGTTTPAANDSNKTENDLCEPKIATSPPISAANDNSAVTTPQTCN